MQVLQCLIAKADAEIHDLEDELAILQCQLKWAESDEQRNPYEVCCATFKQKIDLLTTSIMNFRNKNILTEHGMDTTVEVQRPAERIYDIITALIKKDFAAPGEQVGVYVVPFYFLQDYSFLSVNVFLIFTNLLQFYGYDLIYH